MHTFCWTVGGQNKCMLFTFVPHAMTNHCMIYTWFLQLSYKLIHIMTINDTMRTKDNVLTESILYAIILVNRFHMNWYKFIPYMTSWMWFCLGFDLISDLILLFVNLLYIVVLKDQIWPDMTPWRIWKWFWATDHDS